MAAPKNKTNFARSRAAILLLALLTLIGAHLGAEYHVRFGKAFVRTAIRIEPRIPLFISTPWYASLTTDLATSIEHHKFLADDNAILTCIERYPELKPQPPFSRVAEDQVAAEIFKNVAVKQDREDPSIFELRYRARNPLDGSLILNSLLRSYRESLEIKTEDLAKQSVALLEAEHELEPKKLEAFRSLHTHLHGYRFWRFSSRYSATHYEAARLFWSMFVGAAIAFSLTAAAIVLTRLPILRRTANSPINDESADAQA